MANLIDGVTPAPDPTPMGASSREAIASLTQATPDVPRGNSELAATYGTVIPAGSPVASVAGMESPLAPPASSRPAYQPDGTPTAPEVTR